MIKREKLVQWAPFLAVGALVLVLGFSLLHTEKQKVMHAPLILGTAVPKTNLPLLNNLGERFTTSSWRGRPYIISFFASWSAQYKAEQEELMTLAAAHIPVIGIVFKDRDEKVAAYLEREGNPFVAVALDQDGDAASAWAINDVPETFVIDARGYVQWHHVGTLSADVINDELMPSWEAAVAARK